MGKVQFESKYFVLIHINRKCIFLYFIDLRQAERQGPLSKRFSMLIYL